MKEIETIRPRKKVETVQYLVTQATLLLMLIVIFLEVDIFYLAFKGRITFSLAIILHLAIIACLLIWSLYTDRIKSGRRMSYVMMLFVLGMGPYGAVTCVLSVVLYRFYTRTSTNFSEWFSTLFPEELTNQSALIYERLLYGWDDFSEKRGVMSFYDVLKLGNEEQKRNAIAKMTLYFRPEFTGALQMALRDSSNAIRVQAATAIARIEEAFFKILMELEKYYQETKDDDVLFRLANHADLYYYCGILDEERKAEILQKAITYFSEYLSRHPENKHAQFSLGRLYFNKGDQDAAYALLHGCLEGSGNNAPNVFKTFMECLYAMRKFNDLHEFARNYVGRLDPNNRKSLDVLDMMKLWGQAFPKESLHLGQKYAG